MSVPHRDTVLRSPGAFDTTTLPGMAKLGWFGSVALAIGAAATAAAAQYGLAYGLEIISWTPRAGADPLRTADAAWQSGLAWTTWIAATSTAVGAIVADRRSASSSRAAGPRGRIPSADVAGRTSNGTGKAPGAFATGIWRVLLAVCGAIGALVAVALVLVPARHAIRADTSTPEFIAAAYAIVGIALGIVVAVWALMSRAGTANVITSAIWFWLVGFAAVADGVIKGVAPGSVALAGWPLRDGFYVSSTWSLPGGLLAFGSALIIGVGAAAHWARKGDHRLATSMSGALGPGMVAVAYLIAEPPRSTHDSAVSAAVLAPWATLLGLLASTLLVGVFAARVKRAADHVKADTYDLSWASHDPDGASASASPALPAMGRARPIGSRPPLGEEQTVPSARESSEAATVDVSVGSSVPPTLPVPSGSDSLGRKPQPGRRSGRR